MSDKTIHIGPAESDTCAGCIGIGYGACELWAQMPDSVHPEVDTLEVDYDSERPELCPLRLGYTFIVEETPA